MITLCPEMDTLVAGMQQVRRDIHAHPELGFKEHRTAALVAERLRSLGMEVAEGYGGTGVVGVLHGRRGAGRSIGLRADLDALPIHEASSIAHRSTHEGVMHACGHDGHTAMLLGAAAYLAGRRDFAGSVRFIFQPAEELLLGAKAMIDDGLFSTHPVDTVFSIHNDPKLPFGSVMTKAGPFMAGADHFDLLIRGRSGHAARPEDCVDALVIASQVVCLAQSIVSRRIRPTEPAVLTIAKLHAGNSYNVIPEIAELSGTFRTLSSALSDIVESTLRDLSISLAESFGGSATLNYRRTCPVLSNSESATALAKQAVADVLTDGKIIEPADPIMGTEDFAHMVQARSGCLVRLGSRKGDDAPAGLHNAHFDFNDDLLPVGASIWVRLVERYLAV